ncbi:MAG: branched-chain amino acid ABC transporter permease [Thaumarchaeota archaeon]|nr:branched-chain amino acid ABC transporter permease [Nitrososphaerota archaeon]
MALDLLLESIATGLLIGGFYAALSVGLTISFGLIDIANVAHPAFIILGAYFALALSQTFGIDPIIAGLLLVAPFYVIGNALYLFYSNTFERRGESSLAGLVLFFGLLILLEVGMATQFGVGLKALYSAYGSVAVSFGPLLLPLRFVYSFVAGVAAVIALELFLSRTFRGRAIRAVAQDAQAVSLMGAKPETIRLIAMGVSIATAGLAGGLVLAVGPISPYQDRLLIGRVFAVVVLGGSGSVVGALLGGIVLGISENIATIYLGAGWSLAVSAVILLLVLALRPSGILRR